MKEMNEDIVNVCEYLKDQSIMTHSMVRGIKLILEMMNSSTLSISHKSDLQDFLYETLKLLDQNTDDAYRYADTIQAKHSNPKTA